MTEEGGEGGAKSLDPPAKAAMLALQAAAKAAATAAQPLESQAVRLDEIADVDVVADAGAVGGVRIPQYGPVGR